MDTETQRLTRKLHRDALRFAEADSDGNNELTFKEFLLMQPRAVRDRYDENDGYAGNGNGPSHHSD